MLKSIRHFVGYHRKLLSVVGVTIFFIFAKPTPWTLLAGLPFILIGEALRIWSSGYIAKNRVLVQEGPYALIRHPLYLGNFLIGFGFSLMGGHLGLIFLFLVMFGIIYFSTVTEEETALHARFGEEFSTYASRVPRFIPRVPDTVYGPIESGWDRIRAWREYRTCLAIVACLALMVFKSYYHVL